MPQNPDSADEAARGSTKDRLAQRETLLLYALSAARCAKCHRALVLESEVSGKPFNIGKRAHIVGRSDDGPRGDDEVSTEDRGHLTNHVLLCGACHDEIDLDIEGWPVEKLRALRASHAAWIEERLREVPESPDHQVYAALVQSACELVGLENWLTWTEPMFDLYLSWRSQQIEDVAEFVRRLGATDWPGTLLELECAFKRLGQCLSEAAGTFSDHAESREHDLHVPRWYKSNGWNPHYHRDAEDFGRWLHHYETLLVEASRAADWVRTAWREAGHPLFMLGERPQIMTSNNMDSRLHFYVMEYTPAQRAALLGAHDVRDVELISAFDYATHDDNLARLVKEIVETASGTTPENDVVEHLERTLTTTDGPFDSTMLFYGVPGHMPDAETRKRVSADLLRHGVIERNPNGQGFVVADLDPQVE